MAISKFKEIANVQGFDQYPDLDILYPYIENAKEVLEVGVGYGRVIKGLLSKKFQGNITALDRSAKMCEYLQKKKLSKIQIVPSDIKDYEMTKSFDVVLWLWSGILELDHTWHHRVLKKIRNALKTDGLLVLEIPRQIRYFGKQVDEHKIRVEADWGCLEVYLPSHTEMLAFQKIANFTSVQVIPYEVGDQLKRTLYLYRK